MLFYFSLLYHNILEFCVIERLCFRKQEKKTNRLALVKDLSMLKILIFRIKLFILLILFFGQRSETFFGEKFVPLSDYVIDVFFSNSLTIIRCNAYEREILRSISMGTIGKIKCSNRNRFLPSNHIEQIALLHWNETKFQCKKFKGNSFKSFDQTVLSIKHKPKHVFEKNPLKLIRVGSTDSSKTSWDEKQSILTFQHAPRIVEIKKENFTDEIYSFNHRPIICRERFLTSSNICTKHFRQQNLSWICYYRVDWCFFTPTVRFAKIHFLFSLTQHDEQKVFLSLCFYKIVLEFIRSF